MACDDLTNLSTNILASTGGVLGGTSMMLYMRPSGIADAVRRVVVSTVSAAFLTVPIADKLFEKPDSEIVMGIAFAVGFVAWSLLGAVAKFFEARQGQDIVQMAKAVKPEDE